MEMERHAVHFDVEDRTVLANVLSLTVKWLAGIQFGNEVLELIERIRVNELMRFQLQKLVARMTVHPT